MKRKPQICVVIITLSVILFLGIVAGERINDLLVGAFPMVDPLSFAEAEDGYTSYDVTHPVVSYPEEYYSGDPSRVRRMAYITYDEKRQAFLKIVVSEQDTSGLTRLLRAANMSDEVKESWGEQLDSQLKPVAITGSFVSIEDPDDLDTLFDALRNSDFQGTEGMRTAALAQSDWYVLEKGYIRGVSSWHLWICIVVIGINLLFLLIAIISLLRKGVNEDFLSEDLGIYTAQFLKRQLSWMEPWCKKGRARRTRMAFLVMLAAAAALTGVGFYVGYSSLEVLTCHLPLGLGVGELYGLPLLLGIGLAFNPYKLLKNFSKSFEKLYPIQSDREAIARNLLEADDSWMVREQGKEECSCAILGERYWIVLSGTGRVTLIDGSRVGKMYSETISGQIRTGKVRYNYISYAIYIFYQGDEEKKHANVQFSFNSEGASGHFMALARKRLGDRAQTVMR